MVVLAVVLCLRLGWWQFDRSEDTDGSVQNLGYAVLWPAFAIGFVYMWTRFIGLERQRFVTERAQEQQAAAELVAEAEALTQGAVPQPEAVDDPAPAEPAASGGFVGVVGDESEDADDAELIAYNRALAALAERDLRG